MADDNVRQIRRSGGGGNGEVYVLVAEWRDRASANLRRIRDLCELLRQDRTENDCSLLARVNLVEKLAAEAEAIIDTAPAVGGPR